MPRKRWLHTGSGRLLQRLSKSVNRIDLVGLLLLIFLVLLFFWRVPVQGKVLLPLDVLHTYEPWRSEVPGALGVQAWNPWLTDSIRKYYPLQTVV
jgi:hypothetical protein